MARDAVAIAIGEAAEAEVHQPLLRTLFEREPVFIVNKRVWDGLTDAQRATLETWYYSAWTSQMRDADMEDLRLVARDKAAGDLTIVDWAPEERRKFREIAVEAWEDYAKKSPLAREALDAHINFMKSINLL